MWKHASQCHLDVRKRIWITQPECDGLTEKYTMQNFLLYIHCIFSCGIFFFFKCLFKREQKKATHWSFDRARQP